MAAFIKSENWSCKRCGSTLRYQSSGACISCEKAKYHTPEGKAARTAAINQWREKAKGRAKFLFYNIQLRAKKAGLEFSLDLWGLEIRIAQGFCEATGIPFDMTSGRGLANRSPWGPSVDRIDSTKGYTWDNVQVVCTLYNLAKSNFSEQDVLRMAIALAHKNELS